MFLNGKRSYTRAGEQKCVGKFLVILSHNKYKWADQFPGVPFLGRERILYAHVCHVSMSQCGCWMMGTANTLEVQGKPYKHLVLSGSYGGDGLPCDYEDLTLEARNKLVIVPGDLAEAFWNGGGWNESGTEGPAMAEWARKTFKVRVGKK